MYVYIYIYIGVMATQVLTRRVSICFASNGLAIPADSSCSCPFLQKCHPEDLPADSSPPQVMMQSIVVQMCVLPMYQEDPPGRTKGIYTFRQVREPMIMAQFAWPISNTGFSNQHETSPC